MIIRKSLYGLIAIAVMLAFSPLPTLQAASVVGPGTNIETDNLILDVAKKKGKKKGKKKKKKGKASKAGKCGTYMYWSKSKKKCVDTRTDPPKKK